MSLRSPSCRIADDNDSACAHLVHHHEVIPFAFLPVGDRRQRDLLSELPPLPRTARGQKPDLLGRSAEAREIRAFPVRAGQFAESRDRYAFPVMSRNHRKCGGSAVCRVVLEDDGVSHIVRGCITTLGSIVKTLKRKGCQGEKVAFVAVIAIFYRQRSGQSGPGTGGTGRVPSSPRKHFGPEVRQFQGSNDPGYEEIEQCALGRRQAAECTLK